MPDSATSSFPKRFCTQLTGRFGKSGTILLAVMAVLFVSAVLFAIEAEKPWGRTVQKREQSGQPLRPKEYAVIGLWWGAVVNTGILAALMGSARWWMPARKDEAGGDSPVHPSGETRKIRAWMPSHKGTLALVLGAVVFGAWERWPKLSQSYWNDEEYSIRRFAHGSWEKQNDGTLAFTPVSWTDTLFENRNGNNHLFNSLSARAALSLWRTISGAPREAFDECATRLPQLLAGLGSIVLIFLLGREAGSPLAGLGGAWLLALHPWHLRYSVEMRGYALMLFFVSVALLALSRAMRTERLRWWILFAVGEAMFLLSFAGALYVALVVNLVCAFELMARKNWGQVGRLAAFNALAAVPVIQWMLPSVPQLIHFLKHDEPSYVTDVWMWLHDLVSVLAVGWQFENTWPGTHVGMDWAGAVAHLPVSPGVVAGVLTTLLVTGLILAAVKNTAARLIVIAPVLAALLCMGLNLRPGTPMTVWYLIYLLIPAALAVPLALEWMGGWKNTRWLPFALVAWFTIRYGMVTSPARAAVRDHDRQPIRQTVAFIHGQSPDAITATFGVSDRQSAAYDPGVNVLETEADLQACIEQSRAAMKPLFVYYCSDEHGNRRRPDIYARVVKSGEFERVAVFPGTEELFSYRVYRLNPR